MNKLKKLYEHKIIIGSVLGLLVALTQIIGIFFPDLFIVSSQKNKVVISSVISNSTDFDEFAKKMSEAEEAPIIDLKVGVCLLNDFNLKEQIYTIEDQSYEYTLFKKSPKGVIDLYGKSNYYVWKRVSEEEIDSKCIAGMRYINGLFKVHHLELNNGEDGTRIVLNQIPNELIELENYNL